MPVSREAVMPNVLADRERLLLAAYWRGANYLSVRAPQSPRTLRRRAA
jgi:hypothetical protein